MDIELPLSNGGAVIVDDSEMPLIAGRVWYRMKNRTRKDGTTIYYAATRILGDNGKWRHLMMHRHLEGDPAGILIDHKNGDGLDNRPCNRRRATMAESNRNRRGHGTISRFKGVSRKKLVPQRWYATIDYDKQTLSLGGYKTEEDAALAYDHAARLLHRRFAYLNHPDKETPAHIVASVEKRIRKYRHVYKLPTGV